MIDQIESQTPISPVPPASNPLLERARLPGQTFSLPSKGIFYVHGEVDQSVIASKGEIMVYPMVTMDEINMKTPDKLLNGTAVIDVFKHCIPQINHPTQLLSKDVDFILICLRKVTYGSEYRLDFTHDCENAESHSYSIPLDPLIGNAKKIDSRRVGKDYTLTLPNEQIVKLSPPKYYQMLKFFQTFGIKENENINEEQLAREIIQTTVSMIDRVDNVEDKNMILEWAHTIPAGYAHQIGEQVNKVSSWGADLDVELECRDCNKKTKTTISLNPLDFFS